MCSKFMESYCEGTPTTHSVFTCTVLYDAIGSVNQCPVTACIIWAR